MINWIDVNKKLPKTPYSRKELNEWASWSRVVLVKLETKLWGMATLTVERFPALNKKIYIWRPYSPFADAGDWWLETKDVETYKRHHIDTDEILGEGRRVTHWAYVRLYKERKK